MHAVFGGAFASLYVPFAHGVHDKSTFLVKPGWQLQSPFSSLPANDTELDGQVAQSASDAAPSEPENFPAGHTLQAESATVSLYVPFPHLTQKPEEEMVVPRAHGAWHAPSDVLLTSDLGELAGHGRHVFGVPSTLYVFTGQSSQTGSIVETVASVIFMPPMHDKQE